jgi:asparagine synthase (glutamine-hydrolysing)
MSGIVGIISLTGSLAAPPGVVRIMSAAQAHRGSHEVVVELPGVAFANRSHSALKKNDVISGELGHRIACVYDGRLFNADALYGEVASSRETNGCPALILPSLWRKNGIAMCDRLRGQFAIALWDERDRRLLLARDHFGVCPLHWSRQGDWLLFASEIKALLASDLVKPIVDLRGIHHVWTFFGTPGPVTCFEGVSSLLPGRYMEIRLGRDDNADTLHDTSYWQMDFPDRGQEDSQRDEPQLVDEYEAIMLRAINGRLTGGSSVAAYSSGGLDSSLLVTMAAKLRGQPLDSYTFDIEHPGHNESAMAADVASHVGSRPTLVKLTGSDLLDGFPRLVAAAESPVIDVSASALMQLAERVHGSGHTAVITGEGADELQAGYPWFRIQQRLDWLDRTMFGLPMSVPAFRAYARLVHSSKLPRSFVDRSYRSVGGKNAWLLAYMLMAAAKHHFFSDDMLAALRDHLPFEDLGLNEARMRRWHPLNRSIYLGARVHLAGLHLAVRGDRAAGRSGVETRYPFLDRDLFDFLAPLAPQWKLRGLTDKYLERQLAKRWLPKHVLAGNKRLLHAPLDALHAAQPAGWMDQLLSVESLKKTGYFNPTAVQHWREATRTMRHGFRRLFLEMGLVGVLSTQLWHQQFLDRTLADIDLK